MSEKASKAGLPVLLFAEATGFASWLESESRTNAGVWLLFAKKGSNAVSLSRQEAIDAALCEGWIDGEAATWDDRFFLLRFMPRRPRANWSQINVKPAEELIAEGRMRDAGLAQIVAARDDGRWCVAYPPSSTTRSKRQGLSCKISHGGRGVARLRSYPVGKHVFSVSRLRAHCRPSK